MRRITAVLLWTLTLCGTGSASPLQHEHAHGHASSQHAPAAQGTRWFADAPLQQAMQQIRSARAAKGHSAADALTLAQTIDDAIAFMIRNCTLPADADAALHKVIGQLGAVANSLRSTADSDAAIQALDRALEDYAEQFDETQSS
jgi:hypothetical protein